MPQHAIRNLGNVATVWQLRAAGFSGYQLTRAVSSGAIKRIRRGWYGIEETSAAQYAAVRVGGKLGGLSAAASYGFWSGTDRRIHVLLPQNACRLRTNLYPSVRMPHEPLFVDRAAFEVVLHWHPQGVREQNGDAAEPWRASVIDCLLQVMVWEPAETAIACVDSALGLGLVRGEELREMAQHFGLSRIVARMGQVRHGSDSGLESIARQRLNRVGIAPKQQVKISGVGRVDMLITDARLVLEFDGKQFHGDWESAEQDRRRDALLLASGFRVLRFSYTQVVEEWSFVLRIIRSVLAQV
ncbi:MAG: type IV toxin-antitoxin system AbiEi family antitoxin domain-containing protein [Microbacteriaceae bacterium]